jgi:two-component system, cell cycle sensor histidine kinase and response regulator CckA
LNAATSVVPRHAAADRGGIDARVRAELLAVVYKDQPVSLIAAWIFSFALTFILAYASGNAVLWTWFSGMSVVLGLRFYLSLRFRRLASAQRNQETWEWRFFLGAIATAVFWGWVAWYAYPLATPTLKGVVVVLIGGVVAASSRTVACQLSAYCVYAIVSVLPLVLRLFVRDYASGALLGAFAVLYVMLMLGLGRSFRDTVANTFRLRFENADLAVQLQRDIVAREAAESALRTSEEQLRFAHYALDHAEDLVAIVGRDGRIHHANEALRRYTGRSADEPAATSVEGSILALDADQLSAQWDAVKRSRAVTFETEVLTRIGERRPVEVNASYVEFNGREAVCMIARDLAPRHAAEQEKLRLVQQLQETQRLESLGVLAGGVAHDFNNLLTAILGNASLAKEQLDQPRAVGDMLGQIETAAEQAAGLCRQMLAYAGKGQLAMEPLDVSALVAETQKLLEMTVGRRARLELRLQPDLPLIIGDASQLRQIVLNLVHNAAEAIVTPEGRIVVTTAPVLIDAQRIATAKIRADIPVGEGVALIIEDNGAGMDVETCNRIFEPFFTTKFTGRGLGLAAVLGIVRAHRALLDVQSEPGRGSRFALLIPAIPIAKPKASAAVSIVAAPSRHEGRVLIIDDEQAVRDIARQVLQRIGLTVEVAADGDSALEIIGNDPQRFDLLLIDMTMPGRDGIMTLREIRRRGTRAPAVLMSGFSEHQLREQAGNDGIAEFLQKPFDYATLRSKVEAALRA